MTAKFLFTGLLALAAFGAVSATAGPAVKISDPEFDFGKAPQHAELSHTYVIKSVGDDTLRITKIVPGCGCTKAPVEDSVLAPGDSTLLTIKFDSGRFRGATTKRPYIETNAGPDKYYMKFWANLITDPKSDLPLQISPLPVDVSQFTATPRAKAGFMITNQGGQDLNIKIVDNYNKSFTIDMPNKVKAGESIEGTIKVKDGMLSEEFGESFTIEIDNLEQQRYSVPVKRMVRVKGGDAASASTGK